MQRQRQKIKNLKGEVVFRKKLASQHTTGEMLLPDYFSKDEHDQILAQRIETTRLAFEKLSREGVDFSRFVELGAERGHRSLTLVNYFDSSGIAMDISFDQLKTAEHFSRLFNLPKLPLRVCCDANNLPLSSSSIPFLFCYQFLHHFPSLDHILAQIHRVLASNSTFFFDEEPVGKMLQLHLYKQPAKEYSKSNLQKGKLLRWLESFISETASDEVDHGIIENHAMLLPQWQRALQGFDSLNVHVRTLRHCKSSVTGHMRPSNFLSYLAGGVIYGGCQMKSLAPSSTCPVESLLCCPECLSTKDPRSGTPLESPLSKGTDCLVCTSCERSYPVVDEIPILLTEDLRKELYPQFS